MKNGADPTGISSVLYRKACIEMKPPFALRSEPGSSEVSMKEASYERKRKMAAGSH